MRYASLLLILVGGCILCAGCAPIDSGVARGGGTTANPGNRMDINLATGKMELASNADVDSEVKSIKVSVPKDIKSSLAGADVNVDGFKLTSNSSKVRNANVGQIVGMGQFNEATGSAWSGVIDSMGNIIIPVARQVFPKPAANDAAETASMLITVAIIIGAIVLLIKIWQWLFPAKDPTSMLLVELMKAQKK